jgi:hypothetical protein
MNHSVNYVITSCAQTEPKYPELHVVWLHLQIIFLFLHAYAPKMDLFGDLPDPSDAQKQGALLIFDSK